MMRLFNSNESAPYNHADEDLLSDRSFSDCWHTTSVDDGQFSQSAWNYYGHLADSFKLLYAPVEEMEWIDG